MQVNPDAARELWAEDRTDRERRCGKQRQYRRQLLEHGDQAFNLRAIGQMQTTGDIAQTVLKAVNGTPFAFAMSRSSRKVPKSDSAALAE